MHRYKRQIIRRERSREAEYKAGTSRESNSHLPSKTIGYGSSEQHGDEHPAVVDCPDQSPLPFLTAKVELKEVDSEKLL